MRAFRVCVNVRVMYYKYFCTSAVPSTTEAQLSQPTGECTKHGKCASDMPIHLSVYTSAHKGSMGFFQIGLRYKCTYHSV